jgi:hypothetical protein
MDRTKYFVLLGVLGRLEREGCAGYDGIPETNKYKMLIGIFSREGKTVSRKGGCEIAI